MVDRIREIRGVRVPTFLYGTAWKEEATEELVSRALAAGFRGIDTANQRKHYHEEGVGSALTKALERGELQRDDLFVQTKYTPRAGQDHRLPYDPDASVGEQVQQSFRSSLDHLGLRQLDSYVLHGPTQPRGIGAAEQEAWLAMEAIHDAGGARLLGVSNFGADQLAELLQMARVRPAFVQNRCFARRGWDREMRALCEQEGIVYQGFSLLTANREILAAPAVQQIAARHERTLPQVIFRFALAVGMIPLTGTTDAEHMKQDLQVYDFELDDEEIRLIAGAGT